MLNILSNAWDIDRTNGFINWFYSPELVFGIAKYAICILIGIIVAYLVCIKEGERFGVHHDDAIVCLTIIVPLAILGARIWYMIGDGVSTFENYWYYSRTIRGFSGFGSVFTTFFYVVLDVVGYNSVYGTYDGISGLAIHGGIIVAFSLATLCCFWKKWKPLVLCDKVAPGLFIGQIFGRWGNFFNQEAHGTVIGGWTLDGDRLIPNLTVAEQYEKMIHTFHIPKFIAKNMYIEGNETYYYGLIDGVQKYGTIIGSNFYHPTFLYESLLNLLGLGLYFILRRQKWVKNGFFIGYYLIWYGLVRFFIEIVRTDSLYLGGTGLKLAQVSSIVMILIGAFVMVYIYLIKKQDFYVDTMNKYLSEQKALEQKEEQEEVVNVE